VLILQGFSTQLVRKAIVKFQDLTAILPIGICRAGFVHIRASRLSRRRDHRARHDQHSFEGVVRWAPRPPTIGAVGCTALQSETVKKRAASGAQRTAPKDVAREILFGSPSDTRAKKRIFPATALGRAGSIVSIFRSLRCWRRCAPANDCMNSPLRPALALSRGWNVSDEVARIVVRNPRVRGDDSSALFGCRRSLFIGLINSTSQTKEAFSHGCKHRTAHRGQHGRGD
jgi:hypothetical protein